MDSTVAYIKDPTTIAQASSSTMLDRVIAVIAGTCSSHAAMSICKNT
jgi:hypothetical protein